MYHILVVDDQRDARQVLRSGLETLGPNVQVLDVPSGEEAMLVISRQPIDLMVVDVRLPGISGLELLKKAQVYNPAMRLILVTGMTDPSVRKQIHDSRPDAYFFKPIEMPDFLDAVARCLGLAATILPQKSIQPLQQSAPGDLGARLASLRQELSALCAALIDERGQVLIQAGDFPAGFNDAEQLPVLLAALSAGNRASYTLGQPLPLNMLFFPGKQYDLALAPVGLSSAALLFIPPIGEAKLIGQAWAGLRAAIQDFRSLLAERRPAAPAVILGAEERVPTREAPLAVGEELSGLDDLLSKALSGATKPQDADAFWKTLVEQGETDQLTSADALSYEQARKLGLAPETD